MISNNMTQSLARTSSNSSFHTDSKQSDPHLRTHSTLDTSSENLFSSANYGKKCYICDKNFMFRKRNLCKLCNNYVCSEHFSKQLKDENICDFCDRKEAKRLVKQEIEKEIQILAFELDKTKESSNRVHRDYCQKVSEFNGLEREMEKVRDLADSRKGLMLARITNQRLRTQKNSQVMETSKKIIEEAAISECEMNEKYEAVQRDLLQASTELLNCKAKKNELNQELARKMKSDARTKSLVISKLCQTCQDKLND